QLAPGSHAYNVPCALRLRGELVENALHRAVREIVQRHQSLRTTFRLDHGNLQQVVSSGVVPVVQLIDLSGVAVNEKERRRQECLNSEAQRAFDLARCPLVRGPLLRLNPTDHALLIVMHHTICDGWSMTLFFQELQLLYDAFAGSLPVPALPDLP